MKKNVVRLDENKLRQMVAKKITEILKEGAMEEAGDANLMPSNYRSMFANVVRNAMHGAPGQVKKDVAAFYNRFRGKITAPGFTLENLMAYAERIENNEGGRDHFIPNAERATGTGLHLDDPDANGRATGHMFETKINEKQLQQIIAESIKKVLKAL